MAVNFLRSWQNGKGSARAILLHGPPGCGKTTLVRLLSAEFGWPLIETNASLDHSASFLDSMAYAAMTAPIGAEQKILFFDEIDSITPTRGAGSDSHVTERVISQLLSEIDGLEELHNITVIAASNRPDIIDPALLRPGRIDRLVYVTPPDRNARLEIFKVHTGKTPLDSDVDLEKLAEDTDGFTGADIASVCNEATILAIREYVKSGKSTDDESVRELKVGYHNFVDAMTKVKPYSKKELEKYTKISENFIYQ